MRLSKCSTNFAFSPYYYLDWIDKNDSYKRNFNDYEFKEVCIPVRLPEEIKHRDYKYPNFNIITYFEYQNKKITEEYEIIDSGDATQFTIFCIKDGKTTIIYSNYNGEEEWNESNDLMETIEELKIEIIDKMNE